MIAWFQEYVLQLHTLGAEVGVMHEAGRQIK